MMNRINSNWPELHKDLNIRKRFLRVKIWEQTVKKGHSVLYN